MRTVKFEDAFPEVKEAEGRDDPMTPRTVETRVRRRMFQASGLSL